MRGVLIIGFLIPIVQGCASTMEVFYNRPVAENTVDDVVATVSLSADRRTVIVVTQGEDVGKFCAEAPPDTAKEISTELSASIEAGGQETVSSGVEDNLSTRVIELGERTAKLDAYRTGLYALCQFHLNGAMTNEQVNENFKELIKIVIDED